MVRLKLDGRSFLLGVIFMTGVFAMWDGSWPRGALIFIVGSVFGFLIGVAIEDRYDVMQGSDYLRSQGGGQSQKRSGDGD